MSLFLLFYFTIYGLLHGYALHRARTALCLGRGATLTVAAFMLLMLLTPILIRVAERAGITSGIHAAAYIAFTWMGLLFLFISIAAVTDTIRFCWTLISKRFSITSSGKFTQKRCLYLSLLLVLALYAYGLFEAGRLKTEHIVVKSSKIPPEIDRIRIVQISDVHLGLFIGEKQLGKILKRAASVQPDLLVSTGDLVDGQPNDLQQEADLFEAFEPPLGKVAVTGNHEFYAGLEHSLAFTASAGFSILRNEVGTYGDLVVVGMDDRMAASMTAPPKTEEATLLAALPEDRFILLLKHRPEINPASIGLFDLQLSGHTHKGQIFPFNLFTRLLYPFPAGQLSRLESGLLYVSRGTATWGPPIRILAPPEITIIDLVPGS